MSVSGSSGSVGSSDGSEVSDDVSEEVSEEASDEPTEPEDPDTDTVDYPYFRFVLEKKITEQFYAFNGDPNQIGG